MRTKLKQALYEYATGAVCGLVLLVPIFLIVLEVI